MARTNLNLNKPTTSRSSTPSPLSDQSPTATEPLASASSEATIDLDEIIFTTPLPKMTRSGKVRRVPPTTTAGSKKKKPAATSTPPGSPVNSAPLDVKPIGYLIPSDNEEEAEEQTSSSLREARRVEKENEEQFPWNSDEQRTAEEDDEGAEEEAEVQQKERSNEEDAQNPGHTAQGPEDIREDPAADATNEEEGEIAPPKPPSPPPKKTKGKGNAQSTSKAPARAAKGTPKAPATKAPAPKTTASKKRKLPATSKGKAATSETPRKTQRVEEEEDEFETPSSASGPRPSYLVTADLETFNELFIFNDKPSLDKVNLMNNKGVAPCAKLDMDFYDKMGIGSRIRELVSGIGWESFFFMDQPTYLELSLEFFASFWYKPDLFKPKGGAGPDLSTKGCVNFRFASKWHPMSLNDFNVYLGFVSREDIQGDAYQSALTTVPANFNGTTALRELTGNPGVKFDSRNTKAHSIQDPALRILQRFLSIALAGKFGTSGQLAHSELFFLWAMYHKKRVNLGYWIATSAHNVANAPLGRSPVLGSLITSLASQLYSWNPREMNLYQHPIPFKILGLKTLDTMGFLCVINGILSFHADNKGKVEGKFEYPDLTKSRAESEAPEPPSAQANTPVTPKQAADPREPEELPAAETTNRLLRLILETNRAILKEIRDQIAAFTPPRP